MEENLIVKTGQEYSVPRLFSPFFFSSFDKDQLANIHSHFWKERFKMRKLENFKGYTLSNGPDKKERTKTQ